MKAYSKKGWDERGEQTFQEGGISRMHNLGGGDLDNIAFCM